MMFVATTALKRSLGPLMANDPAGMKDPNAIPGRYVPITAPFTPRLDLVKSDLTINEALWSMPNLVQDVPPAVFFVDSPLCTGGGVFVERQTLRVYLPLLLAAPPAAVVYGMAYIKPGNVSLWGTVAFARPLTFDVTSMIVEVRTPMFYFNAGLLF